jgi:hypothetical protein
MEGCLEANASKDLLALVSDPPLQNVLLTYLAIIVLNRVILRDFFKYRQMAFFFSREDIIQDQFLLRKGVRRLTKLLYG